MEQTEQIGDFLLRPDGKRLLLARYSGPGGQVTLPADVVEIESFAFNQCFNVTRVILPPGLERIGRGAFRGCSRLEELNLPSGLREIGPMAFDCCVSLAGLNIPQGVKEIGAGAFHGCMELKRIALPSGLVSIGAHAFDLRFQKDIQGLVPLLMKGCRVDSAMLEELLKVCWTREDDLFEVAAAYLRSGSQAVMEQAEKRLEMDWDWAVEVLADLLDRYPTARFVSKAAELVRSQAPQLWPKAADIFYNLAQNAGRKKAVRRLRALGAGSAAPDGKLGKSGELIVTDRQC